MTEFLAMGGHGAYVWGAYGASLLALAFVGVWPLAAMRSTVRRLRRRAEAACLRDASSHGENDP